MTAEIAILNKSAVALATDSAVTIAAVSKEEKIFDTADKLFELSDRDPIGIMIYNVTSFVEIPLQILVKKFRRECQSCPKVSDVATCFLRHLDDFGKQSPGSVKDNAIRAIAAPVISQINDAFQSEFRKKTRALSEGDRKQFTTLVNTTWREVFEPFKTVISDLEDASFIGDGEIVIDDHTIDILKECASKIISSNDSDEKDTIELLKLVIRKKVPSDRVSGIVISGFGSEELFPKLISYEIDGFVCNRLKYSETNKIYIDRTGIRARVIPFAQKEMVDRFLYGLDDDIQDNIFDFCSSAVKQIHDNILGRLKIENDTELTSLKLEMEAAEKAFVDGLRDKGFAAIRSWSQSEIEDMVEFMPKPELAKMAEALVNLTSIKRRVSRGMETVAGPIDVAVISQSEGFVWAKRKHYFPPELNARYLDRVHNLSKQRQDMDNVQSSKSGSSNPSRTKATKPKLKRTDDAG